MEIPQEPCSGNSFRRWEFIDAIRASALGMSARFLAYELALRSTDQGEWRTSRADLAQAMGCSQRTVSAATRELEAAGFVKFKEMRWKGRNGWPVFRLIQAAKSAS